VPCSAAATADATGTTSTRADNLEIMDVDRTVLDIVDLYFTFMHEKPHSLFHEATFKAKVRDGTVARAVLLGMLAVSAR
jgi:hypothetical protein